jgi:hypothetical protein
MRFFIRNAQPSIKGNTMDDKNKNPVATNDQTKDACCSTEAKQETKTAEKGKSHCCCCGK